MGRIQIRDRTDEWEVTTASWEGVVEVRLDDGDDLEVVVSDHAPYTPDDIVVSEQRMGTASTVFGHGPTWLLYVPTVLGLLTLAVDELGVLAPFPDPISWAISVGLYWTFFLVGVAGTVFLYNDARALTATDRSWQPNPWPFIIAGGSVVAALQTLLVGLPSGSWQTVVASLGGLFVVGCTVASSIAGPLYLVARHRFLTADAAD
ncbi:hypothetical protein ACFR9U_20940 [Halorientalis brevis]|uniref:Uncharacterized protein n=1 Tax=Halorientalis brevis TaxID=1126241 RepID=A0ABD6CIP9_9EURY|nr:hypothetical protein [Halorientalis brevis]